MEKVVEREPGIVHVPVKRRKMEKDIEKDDGDGGEQPGKERLQKVLQRSGASSRRGAEEMILKGRVSVNGEPVTTLPCFVDANADDIRVDGSRLKKPARVYIALNKPKGYICTSNPAEGRRVVDLIDRKFGLLHTVGRLDVESEGLIILTNDGEITNLATHPRYEVRKTYDVLVRGEVTAGTLENLKKGVFLAEGKATADSARILEGRGGNYRLLITISEGRNREIRRMLAKLKIKARRLRRVAIGIIRLGSLKPGRYRPLTRDEIEYLKSRRGG
jgi:23S rRNA pseudouridine2605 synthase